MVKHIPFLMVLFLGVAFPLVAGASQAGSGLAGSNWVLTEYAVQRAAPVPAVGEQRPMVMFGTDGRVSGTTGCNNFTGPYSEAGDQLSIGPLAVTASACTDEALTRQEQVMTQVMSGPTVAYSREGNRLTLSAPAGALTFAAAVIQNETPAPSELPRTGVPSVGPVLLMLLVLAGLLIAAGALTQLRVEARQIRPKR